MDNVKVVIFAGGAGTRLREETEYRPKPMVTIGGMPILLHIMKIYSHYGFNDFVIALGYKGDMIKKYFLDYLELNNDIEVNLKTKEVRFLTDLKENLKVTLVDTGLDTMTGGRLKKLQKYVGDSTFMVTYGDGVANINLRKLYDYHKTHGKIATITGVRPSSRFGELNIEKNIVMDFREKPQISGSYINGGFFVFEPEFFNYLNDDESLILEREPLEKVAEDKNLMIFKHDGFWKCMDTYKDFLDLNRIMSESAPWIKDLED
ncbi:MAG: glucose-1-phosphate cytidylyltransferase [Candidatus Nanoarchaeia archaeon]|nr:glucose-1-phosphate cytidylyltransferase [Candidatus Nanoarchaeia archaeon]MDD5053844.1 glucose-1-phosphate cytidylyltransferase [Candidatus Nanoarchaeia archaeon]MDD5499601.1 glucose-1-phosphate cytidylyltransferase [Candidatus Nanoarchaeia archaeon]